MPAFGMSSNTTGPPGAAQRAKQVEGGKIDAGTRGAVTGGTQMGALEVLVSDVLRDAGLDQLHIKTRTALELPGYYRPEKKWDLIVVSDGQLVCAVEFKSRVGPSFGNNANNRAEEAIGSATDFWRAYREGRFGSSPEPLLGYFFLLEDCRAVASTVRSKELFFKVDPEFSGASYSKTLRTTLPPARPGSPLPDGLPDPGHRRGRVEDHRAGRGPLVPTLRRGLARACGHVPRRAMTGKPRNVQHYFHSSPGCPRGDPGDGHDRSKASGVLTPP